jgi:hypothetical protein
MTVYPNPFKNSPIKVPELTNYKFYTLIMVMDNDNNVII